MARGNCQRMWGRLPPVVVLDTVNGPSGLWPRPFKMWPMATRENVDDMLLCTQISSYNSNEVLLTTNARPVYPRSHARLEIDRSLKRGTKRQEVLSLSTRSRQRGIHHHRHRYVRTEYPRRDHSTIALRLGVGVGVGVGSLHNWIGT